MNVVIDGLTSFKFVDFNQHFFKHFSSLFPFVFAPSVVDPFFHFLITVGDNPEHDIDALLILEFSLFVEPKHILLIHDLKEVLPKYLDTPLDVCTHIVVHVVLFDNFPGSVFEFELPN